MYDGSHRRCQSDDHTAGRFDLVINVMAPAGFDRLLEAFNADGGPDHVSPDDVRSPAGPRYRRHHRHHQLTNRVPRECRSLETEISMTDYTTLPADLPVPEDDGAADHLPGTAMPDLTLPLSNGGQVDLAGLGPGRSVIYLYPLTGRPGVDVPDGWDSIPGARGCSTEACDFRDHFAELREAGIRQVFGMSSQSVEYQAEVVGRLRLPFAMISDVGLALADALRLPTFSAPGHRRLYSRLTLVIRDSIVEHAFYPVFPPNTHAQQVLDWARINPQHDD
jgi:peroxiredoxin